MGERPVIIATIGKDVKSRSATVLLLIDGVLKRCNFRWVLMNYSEINTSV